MRMSRELDQEGLDYEEPGNTGFEGGDGVARYQGTDQSLATSGFVGYSDRPGGSGAAYLGADVNDPTTWQDRQYAASQGMLARLHQEAGNGG